MKGEFSAQLGIIKLFDLVEWNFKILRFSVATIVKTGKFSSFVLHFLSIQMEEVKWFCLNNTQISLKLVAAHLIWVKKLDLYQYAELRGLVVNCFPIAFLGQFWQLGPQEVIVLKHTQMHTKLHTLVFMKLHFILVPYYRSCLIIYCVCVSWRWTWKTGQERRQDEKH